MEFLRFVSCVIIAVMSWTCISYVIMTLAMRFKRSMGLNGIMDAFLYMEGNLPTTCPLLFLAMASV